MPRLDEQSTYVIRIQGYGEESLVDWFGPANVASSVDEGGRAVTTLTDIVTDQAGLMGLLRHLHGLGIVLLSVARIQAESVAQKSKGFL